MSRFIDAARNNASLFVLQTMKLRLDDEETSTLLRGCQGLFVHLWQTKVLKCVDDSDRRILSSMQEFFGQRGEQFSLEVLKTAVSAAQWLFECAILYDHKNEEDAAFVDLNFREDDCSSFKSVLCQVVKLARFVDGKPI